MNASDPELLWAPDRAGVANTRIEAFMDWLREERRLGFDDYHGLWEWSVSEVAEFWDAIGAFFDVRFSAEPQCPLAESAMPGARWFPGAELNYAEHLLGAGGTGTAIIAVHEERPTEEWDWQRLRTEVAGFAAYLRHIGVGRGDRVVAFLPNIPEAIVAFLAAASVGAVFAICGPEFGAASVLARFGPLEPAVLIAQPSYHFGGRYRDRSAEVDALRRGLPSLKSVVTVGARAPMPATASWADATAPGDDATIEPVPFDHPLWVLFSSGTTGTPKGIVHGHGGILLEHLKLLGLHMDVRSADRLFWYTSTSWMVWNAVVSGLLVGSTVILYDGSPTHPSPDKLWSIVDEQRITVLGTSAAYLHACAKAGLAPIRDHDLSALRALHSTGSPLSADGFRWAHRNVGEHVPLFSSSGGTDIASAFVGGNPLLPVRVGEIPGPCLGANVQAWDTSGRPVVGQVGELVVTEPMPSMPLFFWNDPDGERYRSSYFDTFPGVWRHGDWIEITERGSAIIHGRSDATLNRSGIRIGTAEIYQAVEAIDEVAEALAVGIDDAEGGYWLPLFVVLKGHRELDDQLIDRINETVRREASPRHVPDEIIAVPGIPHTLTGKKLEVPIKRLLKGLPVGIDPDAVDQPLLLEVFARLRDAAEIPTVPRP
jgi:acetoacetyl-CoA synthetase